MTDIPLRWQLLLFFCLLGLLPQMAISYFATDALTRSLEEIYDNQISQLIKQAVEQTSAKADYLMADLKHEAQQPYLQLSFQQFPQKTRIQLLQERLELFRTSRQVYSRINLCYFNGGRLVSTSNQDDKDSHYLAFEQEHIPAITHAADKAVLKVFPGREELVLFIPVFSYRYTSRKVGFMVAYLPTTTLTTYLEKLVLGEHAEKLIQTAAGETVKTFNPQPKSRTTSAIRTYKADIESLAWLIDIRIAEDDLFSDVIALKQKNTLFIGAIIVFALVASFVFSQKFTKPFGKIIAGTRAYALGDLEHRIMVKSGREAKQLATAFNDMACQLDERQMELNQSVRLASLGMMTAGIGHEIKNPLTGIKTSSQVINKILLSSRFLPGNDEKHKEIAELAKGISDETDRLTNILNDLLELGKPRKPELKIVEISTIVQRVVDIIQPEFNKKQVQLDVRVLPLQVFVDPDQILQVMLNLLLNGLEAVVGNKGEVAITSEMSAGGSAVLRIVDNGDGIADDKLQHIFDPFFSLRKEGTGLGLSVVYTLLKQNNAGIRVTSKVNKGTAFDITFAPVTNSVRNNLNDGHCHS